MAAPRQSWLCQWSWPLRPLAVLALVAFITACGSNATAGTGALAGTGSTGTGTTAGAGSSGTNSTAANLNRAVKFSQCMRGHGVASFPDPNAASQLTMDGIVNGSGLDPNTPAFQQALSACKDLEPPGFMGNIRTPQQQAAAIKFAQCIRDNGVPDFPDPTADGALVDTNRIPSSNSPDGMSNLHAAMHKCGAIYAGELGLRGQ
jgi:hypothetical protein